MSLIPVEIGLPATFDQFRVGQLESAVDIAANPKRFCVLSAPTGAGKSVIYMAVAKLLDVRAVVLTNNKALQEQLTRDFGAIGLMDIRGQSNYPCKALEGRKGYHGCDKGPCHHGAHCSLHPRSSDYVAGCGFYDRLSLIRRSRLVVTNYDFWMSSGRYMDPGIMGKFDLLILDEAHSTPDKLAEFCEVTLTEDDCQEFIQTGLPPVEDGVESWVDWAEKYRKRLERELEGIKDWAADDPDTARRLRNFAGSVIFLSTAHQWERANPGEPTSTMPGMSNDWVAEVNREEHYAIFSPVWAHRYAEKFLFMGVPKVLLVSATILPRTAVYLGIRAEDMEYYEHQSGFQISRRPVYVVPGASISRNSGPADYRYWNIVADRIIGARRDRKGIVHTRSYNLAYTFRQGSQYKGTMVWHKSANTRDKVEEFKRSGAGWVLVSPSVDQGFDFPYSQCEFQIIAKVPFLDTRSAVVAARCKQDGTYQDYCTVLTIIQMCGRGMRAADDQCETFIIDDNFKWFFAKTKKLKLWPAWFQASVKYADQIPQPPAPIKR